MRWVLRGVAEFKEILAGLGFCGVDGSMFRHEKGARAFRRS